MAIRDSDGNIIVPDSPIKIKLDREEKLRKEEEERKRQERINSEEFKKEAARRQKELEEKQAKRMREEMEKEIRQVSEYTINKERVEESIKNAEEREVQEYINNELSDINNVQNIDYNTDFRNNGSYNVDDEDFKNKHELNIDRIEDISGTYFPGVFYLDHSYLDHKLSNTRPGTISVTGYTAVTFPERRTYCYKLTRGGLRDTYWVMGNLNIPIPLHSNEQIRFDESVKTTANINKIDIGSFEGVVIIEEQQVKRPNDSIEQRYYSDYVKNNHSIDVGFGSCGGDDAIRMTNGFNNGINYATLANAELSQKPLTFIMLVHLIPKRVIESTYKFISSLGYIVGNGFPPRDIVNPISDIYRKYTKTNWRPSSCELNLMNIKYESNDGTKLYTPLNDGDGGKCAIFEINSVTNPEVTEPRVLIKASSNDKSTKWVEYKFTTHNVYGKCILKPFPMFTNLFSAENYWDSIKAVEEKEKNVVYEKVSRLERRNMELESAVSNLKLQLEKQTREFTASGILDAISLRDRQLKNHREAAEHLAQLEFLKEKTRVIREKADADIRKKELEIMKQKEKFETNMLLAKIKEEQKIRQDEQKIRQEEQKIWHEKQRHVMSLERDHAKHCYDMANLKISNEIKKWESEQAIRKSQAAVREINAKSRANSISSVLDAGLKLATTIPKML